MMRISFCFVMNFVFINCNGSRENKPIVICSLLFQEAARPHLAAVEGSIQCRNNARAGGHSSRRERIEGKRRGE